MVAANPPDTSPGRRARDCVRLAPPPTWAEIFMVPDATLPKGHAGLVRLFVDQQAHAPSHQVFHRVVTRVESRDAARKQSPWRLTFFPAAQSIDLHWVRLIREGRILEQADPTRLRVLDHDPDRRRGEHESSWASGAAVLEMHLDEVVPGDRLEVAFTVVAMPGLFPERFANLFLLPTGAPVLNHRFRLRFREGVPMAWRADTNRPPNISHDPNGELIWDWAAWPAAVRDAEPATPAQALPAAWVHVSDYPQWEVLGRNLAEAGERTIADSSMLTELAQRWTREHTELGARVEAALRYVQDEHRCLSAGPTAGTLPLTAPDAVLQRRSGDGRELAWLLVRLLRELGLKARTIGVSPRWRESLAHLLPDPTFLDHALVEFQVTDHTICIDPGQSVQGGGPLGRHVPLYRVGLRCDATQAGLVRLPPASLDANVLTVTEAVLLDTTGASSFLSVLIEAAGSYADALRAEFAGRDVESVGEDRLKAQQARFTRVRRSGPLEYRDERARGVFRLAEVYEIEGVLSPTTDAKVCWLRFPEHPLLSQLRLPSGATRRAPLSLPGRGRLNYTVTIESSSLQPMASSRSDVTTTQLEFSRRDRSLYRSYSAIVTLGIKAEVVPAAQLEAHTKAVTTILRDGVLSLQLPTGVDRPTRRRDFGQLPVISPGAMENPRPRPTPPPAPTPLDLAAVRATAAVSPSTASPPITAQEKPQPASSSNSAGAESTPKSAPNLVPRPSANPSTDSGAADEDEGSRSSRSRRSRGRRRRHQTIADPTRRLKVLVYLGLLAVLIFVVAFALL